MEPLTSTLSRFLRTTWLLSAVKRLDLLDQSASIRRICADESRALADEARRRNVFARHSWENSFYLKRIGQLEEATVIEVLRPGELDAVLPTARAVAASVEKVAFISSTLGLKRERTHQLVAISRHRRYGFDLAISPGFRYLRSSERQEAAPRGVPVDDSFVRRFNRCGFPSLVAAAASGTDIGRRLEQSVNWLFESRQETSVQAAVVKTAIAFESLLIASDKETLRGPLAERTAFLLADDAARRRRIAKGVRAFYDLRSSIVHGGRRRMPPSPAAVLEGIDRVLVLLMLTVAANAVAWTSIDVIVDAVEDRKWGAVSKNAVRPFPESHLSRALRLLETTASPSAA